MGPATAPRSGASGPRARRCRGCGRPPTGCPSDVRGEPRAAIGDKGYASKANRRAAQDRGIVPVIPHKANEKNKPAFFARTLYKGRARIEQAVGKLKRLKRVALRCEKTKRNFTAIVALAAAFVLVKSVHTA